LRINKNRVQRLNQKQISSGPVVYWMSRDQRVEDNWALIYAQHLALDRPLIVVFNLVNKFSEATWRQYSFMLEGLKQVHEKLKNKNIPFYILTGSPSDNIPGFLKQKKAGALVTDFDPLKIKRSWIGEVKDKIEIAFFQVDAHNIVPCWEASQKQEYAAYTIRPKINKLIPDFLTEFPDIKKRQNIVSPKIDWKKLDQSLQVNRSVKPVDWIQPGATEAQATLKKFITNKLENYPEYSNNPNRDVLSNMSPYLHFGQISAQRIALEINKSETSKEAREEYIEQLIIRRELSDNYCYYNENYDSFVGFPDWSQKTIAEHENDQREYIYSREQFENAKSHDPLWNAAQNEMLKRGKMHGYMRMYWAKKILEWTPDIETAFQIALYLNDKYELDGRDPNGYVGVAWSMGGVHDRAWKERAVFGKLRYMNYNGCKRKFDVNKYIEKWN